MAKNPPQPSFDNNYHQKVNIEEGLRKINIKNTNMYKFHQEVKLVFDSLGDQHLNFKKYQFKVESLYFTDPLKLSIRMYEGNPRMFGEVKPDSSDYKHFRNHETLFNTIQNNVNIPIKSINGKDPFDFITYFSGGYEKLKSLQGTFRYQFYEHNDQQNFFDYPLSKEDLYNFTVIYDNGDNFITDYVIYSNVKVNVQDLKSSFKTFVNTIKEYNKTNDGLTKNFILNNIFIARNEKLFQKLYKNQNINKEKILFNSDDWNYNYDNSIACKIDQDNKVNIYAVTNFGFDSTYYSKVVKQCSLLFDKNKYPVIVINIFNGGGLVYNSQYLLELISPLTELNYYGAIRKTDIFDDETSIIEELTSSFPSSKNFKPYNYKSLMKTKKNINYGNSISDNLIGPIIYNGKDFTKEINNIRKNMKNPRKPTEILVYTDGFSYSATSFLLKYLQYYGGGITAGYFSNPNLENIPYDSSLSPSSIFLSDLLLYLNVNGYKTLYNKYNYAFVVPGTQSFYTPDNLTRPLEYEVTPVDEKVNVYFDKVYNSYDRIYASDLTVFIEDSLKIFEKYKTYCNPNNKKLLLITSECDSKFKKHTHGGYECGDDGLWTKKCVASYCDIGYIFDHKNKKCIKNVCRPGNILEKFLIIIFSIIGFVVLLVIGICIGVKIKDKNRKKRYALNEKQISLGVEENTNTQENLVE